MNTLTLCLIICALTVICFVWNKWSMATVAMASMTLFIITGCVTTDAAFANFGNTNGIMLMAMFVVAAGFRRTQFVHNVAGSVSKFANGNLTKIMAAYVLITVVLSQFIQSPVAVFGIMSPMLASTCAEIKVSPSKVMYPLGVAAIATCSAFPLGTGATVYAELNNYIQKMGGYEGFDVGLFDPMKGRLPVVIVCVIYCIFFATKFAPEKPIVPIADEAAGRGGREKEALKPFQERCGYIIFIAVTLGLIFLPQINALLRSNKPLFDFLCTHYPVGAERPVFFSIGAHHIALIGAVLMVMTGVLSPREATESMPVWMYLLLVGCLTMGTALTTTGADKVIGDGLANVVGKLGNQYLIGMVFFLVPFILTQFMNNRTVMQVFIPISAMTCKSLGANPVGIAILVQTACLAAFMTPMATPAVPQYMAAGGYNLKSTLKQSVIPCIFFCVVSVLWIMTVLPMY